MVELGMPKPKYPEELYLERDSGVESSPAYEVQLLGSGRECIVFPIGTTGKRVAAVRFNSEVRKDDSVERAKKIFYTHRILNTLFPHNFPRMYASFGAHPDPEVKNVTGTIRQRVIGNQILQKESSKISSSQKSEFVGNERLIAILTLGKKNDEVIHPFSEAYNLMEMLGLSHHRLDLVEHNFMLGDDGCQYYVDVAPDFFVKYDPKDRIIKYMQENNYSNSDIKKVENSFIRLQALKNI